ncbi:MAG: sugar ABC transporter permease [Anaerolineales bacterium]|nr:sugar ABC transporter permease [Anaerolineales bacterium]MCA9930477.1 sugar ABC transporter permease [Anaerolineales bacterium]
MSDSRMAQLSAWQQFWQSKRNRRRVTLTVKFLFAAVTLAITLLPILFTLSSAFNGGGSLSATRLLPAKATLENFRVILVENDFWLWLRNSVTVSSISAVLSGFLTMLTAFSFSRFRFRGREHLLLSILIVQVFPSLLAMIALFSLLQQIGQYVPFVGLNQLGGLIFLYLGGAISINVWLMKGFFDSVPREIDEAGMVEGATHWQIFWKLLFPLVRPIILVIMILTFFGTFGDWLLPRLMIQDTDKYTLMLGLQQFIVNDYGNNWGTFAAGAVLGAIPQVTVFIILQEYIVGGLTAGSVKG